MTPIYDELVRQYSLERAQREVKAKYDEIGPVLIEYPDEGVPPFPEEQVRQNLSRALLSRLHEAMPFEQKKYSTEEFEAWTDGATAIIATLLTLAPPTVQERPKKTEYTITGHLTTDQFNDVFSDDKYRYSHG